ncbi:hypothetical protein RF11_13985 [Thelohanellus kitauei]|uniref:CRIB domain-containing protein n=1 Tax=Thelohanellus kitauei TaxID=669202 RepID=A0A0C2MH83_THEKT|nr:hypothetical protein RF11_13985 [Thelohanellus kitauei]
MTSKKKEAVTRDMIGEPFHFRHTTHVYKDSEDSFFKGVPAKWREAFADSSRETGSVDEGDRFKLSELLSSPGLHTLKTKRDRIEPLSEENDFNLDCLKGFRSSNIFYESPFLIINHISVVIDNGSWGILYGSKKGTKQVFVFKFHRLDQKTNMKFIRNEIEFHSECSHINIVDFVEAHIWDQSAILTFTSNREIPLYDLIQFVFSDRFDKEDKRYIYDPHQGIIAMSLGILFLPLHLA